MNPGFPLVMADNSDGVASAVPTTSSITEPAAALLARRELSTLKLLSGARLLMLVIMLPLAWLLGASPLDQIATTGLLGIYAVGVAVSVQQLYRARSLRLAGLIGAVLDVLLISLLPLIWYLALGSSPLPTGILLKSSITLLAILLVVLNALAMRPLYPFIVTVGTLLVHGILLGMAVLDEQTVFTSSYLVAYTSAELSSDAVTTRLVVLTMVGLILTFLAARTRRMVIEAVDLQRTTVHLGRYFSPTLVSQLAANPSLLRLGGERRELSFVFTDLAGFTALVETTEPEVVIPLLNGYLNALVQVAFRHGGTVDKLVGDAVQVIFGAPLAQSDHAARAVACALEMDAVAERYREATRATAQLGITRIGVNSGPAIVGNFGAEDLFDYTAYGDAVNIAARLESANRHLGTRILVSADTVARVTAFRGRPVGRLRLSGKHHAVMVYEPLDAETCCDGDLDAYLTAFEAMHAETPQAPALFERLAERRPGDLLIRFHHERIMRGITGSEIVLLSK